MKSKDKQGRRTSDVGGKDDETGRAKPSHDVDLLANHLRKVLESPEDAGPLPSLEDGALAPLRQPIADLLEHLASVRARSAANETHARIATEVSTATAQVLPATRQQAEAASEQAAAVAEILTIIEQVNEAAEKNVTTNEETIRTAEHSEQASQAGEEAVAEAVDGARILREKVEEIGAKILDLTTRTQQIGEIISSVSEIAEQSKLLALNASIEAARAGEHGRGFAVVALEIRTLAEQSKLATQQVRKILGEIVKASRIAAKVTESGANAAQLGADRIKQVGDQLGELSGVVREMTEGARNAVYAMRQQALSLKQVDTAIHQINDAAQQTVATTQNTEIVFRRLLEIVKPIHEEMAQRKKSAS